VCEIAGWTRSTVITNKVPGGQTGAQTQSEQARHLLTLILILSEASRSHDVMATVANAIDANADTPLTLAAIDTLVRDWGQRSKSADAIGVAVRNMP
jgi:Ribosome inactivating protein